MGMIRQTFLLEHEGKAQLFTYSRKMTQQDFSDIVKSVRVELGVDGRFEDAIHLLVNQYEFKRASAIQGTVIAEQF
jgi:hypothetical protein